MCIPPSVDFKLKFTREYRACRDATRTENEERDKAINIEQIDNNPKIIL